MKNKKLKPVTLPEIMFVCTGNTCRSPMAEHLMRWLCREKGISADVYSRGIFAKSSYVSQKAEDVMLELDPLTEISRHIPLSINYGDFENAGLVLTMEEKHLEDVEGIAYRSRLGKQDIKRLSAKVFTLKEYAGFTSDFDISDPICAGYTFTDSSVEEDKGNSYGKVDSIRERWKEDHVKALNVYRECRDEIRQCLERIIANPKPDVRAILKARAERVKKKEADRKKNSIESRYAGALPYGKSSNAGASFWEKWDAAKAGGKENQASFIPGRTYGSARDVIDVESRELTEAEIHELNEEWARSEFGKGRRGDN